jgi:hypothetical protein
MHQPAIARRRSHDRTPAQQSSGRQQILLQRAFLCSFLRKWARRRSSGTKRSTTFKSSRGTAAGNLIVRWTNDEYLSTKHRVINPNDVKRYSIPVFFGPSGDALIEVLPTCQPPQRPPLYEPITYLAHSQMILRHADLIR